MKSLRLIPHTACKTLRAVALSNIDIILGTDVSDAGASVTLVSIPIK